MCAICDRLSMRVVAIDFNDYAAWSVPTAERERIVKAIEAAYEGTGRRVYVIDEDHNERRPCRAYPDGNGEPAVVHFGHCAGAFEGIPKCKYYDESRFYHDEQCRYGKGED